MHYIFSKYDQFNTLIFLIRHTSNFCTYYLYYLLLILMDHDGSTQFWYKHQQKNGGELQLLTKLERVGLGEI